MSKATTRDKEQVDNQAANYGLEHPQRFSAGLSVTDGQAVPSMKAAPDGGWVQVEDYEALRRTFEALFTQDCIDAGDGELMVPSDVNPDRLVPDFKSGLRGAMTEAVHLTQQPQPNKEASS